MGPDLHRPQPHQARQGCLNRLSFMKTAEPQTYVDRLLDAIVGRGHGFSTVKPLKLFKKIIQIWCSPDGVVMDPFAGSGTTGHAVLELNEEKQCAKALRPDRTGPTQQT